MKMGDLVTSSTSFLVSMSLLMVGGVARIFLGWFVSACSSRTTASGGGWRGRGGGIRKLDLKIEKFRGDNLIG